MPIVLSQNGIIIPTSVILNKYGREFYNKFRDKLTVKTQMMKEEKILKMYKIGIISQKNTNLQKNANLQKNIEYIQVPRTLGPKIKKMFPDEVFINKLEHLGNRDIKRKEGFELYPNQQIMINKLLSDVFCEERRLEGQSCCLAKMGTGQGKTFLAAAVIAELNKKTLIIVHDKGMRDNEFSVVMRDTLDATVCIKNKEDLIKEADITILVINTAMNKPVSFFKQFGLIILDEVHMYCSEKRSQIFWKINSEYVMGMSATPDEHRNGFWKMSLLSVGNIIDVETLDGYEVANAFNGEVIAINYYAPDEYIKHETNESSGMLMTHKTVERAMEDPYRMQVLMDILQGLMEDPTNYVYIFCQYRDMVMNIFHIIKDKFPIFAPEAYSMMGGITDDVYNTAKANGRIILITYSYGGTGKSIARMTAAIFASPMRSNWKQITGRILRLGSDPDKVRTYYDIIDARTMLRFQFHGTKKDKADRIANVKGRRISREEVYESRGFPITHKTIHHSNVKLD